jgi:hypothetical protein
MGEDGPEEVHGEEALPVPISGNHIFVLIFTPTTSLLDI